jgi:glutaredoxin
MSTEKVQRIIDENAVGMYTVNTTLYKANNVLVVFSKSYCPYCVATKRKLRGMKAKFELLELNKMSKS